MPIAPDSGFDRVTAFYDLLARLVYGTSLQKAQLWLLPFIPKNATILIVGGGSGWLLKKVIEQTSPEHILYLEASSKMLQRAQQQIHDQTIVTFRHGSEGSLKPGEQFDAIITPFVLDLYPDRRLSQLMQRLKVALKPKGLWLFADFWPTQYKSPFWQKVLTKSMYLFFGILSDVKARQLPNYRSHFKRLGFQEKRGADFYSGFVQAKVFKLS